MPLSPARPPPRGGVAFAITLLVHGALAFLCFAGRRPVTGDDGGAIHRDWLVLIQPARGIFSAAEPGEPPYGTSERVRREDVEISGEGNPLFEGGGAARYTHFGFPQPARRACFPFPLVHEVDEGETLASVARLYGIRTWRLVYYHPANTWFSRRRPHPDRIFPGDRIVIPAPAGEIDCADVAWWL
jgi:hypothetical protein